MLKKKLKMIINEKLIKKQAKQGKGRNVSLGNE